MVTVQYEAVYAGEVARVLTILTDEAFLAEYAKEIGATGWDINVDRQDDRTSSEVRLTVPTDRMPSLFRRFVPPSLEIVETRVWPATSPDNAGRRGDVAVDTAVGKRDARVRGRIALDPVEDGARFSMSGDVKVNLPLVGGQAATLLKDLIVRVLGNQTTVVNRWIT